MAGQRHGVSTTRTTYRRKGKKLRENLAAASTKWEAFTSKPKEQRDDFYRAADYTDEWFSIGRDTHKFRAFYVCGRKWGGEILHSSHVEFAVESLAQRTTTGRATLVLPHLQRPLQDLERAIGRNLQRRRAARYIKAPAMDQAFIDIKAKAVETYKGAERPNAGISPQEASPRHTRSRRTGSGRRTSRERIGTIKQ